MQRVHVQPLLTRSAANVQHLRVLVDAVDHSESFSVDLDQCSCFVGKIVTPGSEQLLCDFDFLVAVCESAIVPFAALVGGVTWVEPHRGLFVIVTEVSVSIERNICVPHGHHRFDNPSFESGDGVHIFCVQFDQLLVRKVVERIEVFGHVAVSASSIFNACAF